MTKCFSQSDDYFIKTSKYVILCRFSPKKEILQLNLMPLIQSSKPGHLYFCQKFRVNKTDAKLNEIKLQKNCKKLFVYLKYCIKDIAAKTQPGVSSRRGDFQARNYDYAKRRLEQNNIIFTRKIFCCRVANSIDFYLSSSMSSVYFSTSKFEFKNLNFFEFKNINGSTL